MGPDDLTETELRLYAAVADGRPVDLTGAADREVRASALTLLLHDPPPPDGVPGLRLRGARVTGRLRLRGTVIDHPLVFTECEFDEPPQLMESITRTLRFTRCRMPGLGLARLRLDGALSLKDSVITGRVDLDHAQIDGELHLSGATLSAGPAGDALHAEGLQVTGVACFDRGFTSTGGVRLPHARFGSMLRFSDAVISTTGQWGALTLDNSHIAGSLTLRSASVSNPGGVAIAAGGLRSDGALWLNHGFSAVGEVRFIGATLHAPLTMSDASLKDASLNLEAASVSSLHAPGIVVEGGQIRLVNARLTGDLELSGARVTAAQDGIALAADGMTATTARLDGLTAQGRVSLRNGGVGEIDLTRARLEAGPDGHALRADRLRSGGLTADFLHAEGRVLLRGAAFTGDVQMGDCRLVPSPDGQSLIADNMEAVNVLLPRLHAGGLVSLVSTRVTGDLDLAGARLDARDRALDALSLTAGGVQARRLHAEGHVAFDNARITQELDIADARLGTSLSAAGLTAGGVLARGLEAGGPVVFDDAQLTRELELKDTKLGADGDGLSLSADGLAAGELAADGLAAAGRVSLLGVQIAGDVLLAGARVGADDQGRAVSAAGLHAVHFIADGAEFEGRVSLRGAQVAGDFRLIGARVSCDLGGMALLCNGLGAGQVLLNRLHARGRIAMRNAQITADLSAEEAVLVCDAEGRAFSGEGLTAVNARMARLRAQGKVSLRGSHFSGVIELADAHLTAAGTDPALLASWVTAGGLLLNGLTATGRIVLRGSQVNGQTYLDGARLTGDGENAIVADGLHTRTLRLHGARFEGEVNLRVAQITDQLFAREAEFVNPGGVALRLSRAEVVGDVFLERTAFTGTLRVAEARIGRTLQLRETVHEQPDGRVLEAKGLQAGRLVLKPARLAGTVQLSHARLGILEDDPSRWPEAMELDGLVYEALEPRTDPQARLDWLSRDPRGFQPQPYEQLAAHYTALGQQHHAQTVLLARERRQGRGASGAGRIWSRLQDVTVGYGYQPARAAAWLALLVAIGSVVFSVSEPRPIKKDEHPDFNPVMYTVDLLLPIVDLGQERAFNPVDLHQWFSYLLVAAGWILATTIAAGAARTIGRR
ncbi:translocation/assembly module TamB domain-containing protein [Actinocorallia populi]|uniref:hypothetical protein n=1 Tax=Actinocorallia populi TaxID=2079200 RepID=UPI000D08B805|nr:hypothetical protein [Actinocorallia populi]